MVKEYLKVSELNQLIQDVMHAGFPQPLWVCGEIQGYDRNRGKNHIFFELVEKDQDSKKILAKIGLVIFSGRKAHLNDVLKRSENAFSLKDDIEVKFACSIDFYPPHGAVRLIVESIDPTYTLGRVAQEKQKLIAQLKKKGTFDKNKQQELSPVPLNIGLITADDSAAYNDFCSELSRSGFSFRIIFHNALMQGSGAEKAVCKAVDKLSVQKGLDAIVITRGGGSIADLSCFDSQMIAEKIADCQLPVLSGIGHEINLTITDLAAHTYEKTPTAIAQHLVSRVQLFLDELNEKIEYITDGAIDRIEDEKQKLKNLAGELLNNTSGYLKEHQEKIIRMREVIKQRPVILLRDQKKVLNEHQKTIKQSAERVIINNRRAMENYQKIVDIVHPANTIKRGFSITRRKDGSVLKSAARVKPKEQITTELADGKIDSTVTKAN